MNADLLPDQPGALEPLPTEPDDESDLDYEDMPCTDGDGLDGGGDNDSRWDAFIPDEDEWDPQPDPGDFWIEDRAVDGCLLV